MAVFSFYSFFLSMPVNTYSGGKNNPIFSRIQKSDTDGALFEMLLEILDDLKYTIKILPKVCEINACDVVIQKIRIYLRK